MSKAALNLLVDTFAAAVLTAMVGTGYVLWFVLPPGTHRTHVLWGLLRHQWGSIHFWISLLLLALLAIHAALHWRWLVMGLSRRLGMAVWAARSPRLAGLLLLSVAAAPLTTMAIAAHLSVRPLVQPLHPIDEQARVEMPLEAPLAGAAAPAPPDTQAVADLLVRRCARCHGERDPAGGLRADTPAALREEQGGIRWVTSGSAGESRLFQAVGLPAAASQIAPYHRLSRGELDTLQGWIASLHD
jgi:mono/diheme cytochrome c family protein